MDSELKAEWVAALRSDRYKQGIGSLRFQASKAGEPDTFCCLGVLCDLLAKRGEGHWETDRREAMFVFGDGTSNSLGLPEGVRLRAGLAPDDTFPYVVVNGKEVTLDILNDRGTKAEGKQYTFADLADLIEEQL